MSNRWDTWRARADAVADALVAWSASAWARWLGIGGCVAVGVAVVWIGVLQAELLRAVVHKDAGATPLDLQLAFTAAEWDWILTHWGARATAVQAQSLWVDFLLIAGYATAGLLGLGALARRLPAYERARRRRMAGYAIGALLFAAGVDVVENVAMLRGLGVAGARGWMAPLASGCAVLKWAGLAAAATYAVAWCAWRWRVPRWEELPNPQGLHDMTGNVWEWCEGWHDKDRDGRALRGGSFRDPAGSLGSSRRRWGWPTIRNQFVGFRVVRSSLSQHGASSRSLTP